MVSAREAVERERRAFVDGGKWRYILAVGHSGPSCIVPPIDDPRYDAEAAKRYPLPTVTRPRVVDDNPAHPCGEQWCVIDGTLRYRYAPGRDWMRWSEFRNHSAAAPTPGRVALWADLLANPTETVEADEAVADDVVNGREP